MAQIKGGEKLEAYLRDLSAKVTEAGAVKSGFLAGATYPDGTSVALVAAVQNFGSQKIPPRPFFSNMVKDRSGSWGPALAAALQASDFRAKPALEMMGEQIDGELRQSIIDFSGVPLKPATIRRKGFDKQLVESGVMLGSVDHEVT